MDRVPDIAADLLTRGCWLFPLRQNAKKPAHKGWQREATRDPAQVKAWIDAGYNLGVYTGKFGADGNSALLVLDVDVKKGKQGRASLLNLELSGIEIPDTFRVRTTSGGEHVYLSVDSPVRGGVNVLGDGLDVRSDGGLVVAPGASFDGKAYVVTHNDPIAPASVELTQRLGRPQPRISRTQAPPVRIGKKAASIRAVHWLEHDAPLAIEGSGGDTTTYKVAARMKDIGVDEATCLDLMLQHWNERCSPPWDADKLKEKVDHAYRYGRNVQGADAPEAVFSPVVPAGDGAAPAQEHRAARVLLERGSDVELGRAIISSLHSVYGRVIFCAGGFWRFDTTHWRRIDDVDIRRLAHRYDGAAIGNAKLKLTKARLDSILHEAAVMATEPGFFDKSAVGINCKSGFLTVERNGAIRVSEPSPEHRVQYVIGAEWKPDAPTWRAGSLMEKLLTGCFYGDADASEKIELIGEIMGSAAVGCATRLLEPKAAVLWGQSAGNGKSQVLDAARGLLPAEAVAAIPPGKFSDDKFVMDLAGKALNCADELSSAYAIGSDSFKAIITGEPITARSAYRNPSTFRPKAQHIFAANVLPPFNGGFDAGVQRRLIVVPFCRSIPRAERIEGIGARVAADETDLLLAFAVAGASRLIERRHFNPPPSCQEALRSWILGADPVIAWAGDRIDFAAGERLRKSVAYTDFKSWAARSGFDAKRLPAINNFVQRLHGLDPRIGDVRNATEGRCFVGVRLLPATDGDFSPVTEAVS